MTRARNNGKLEPRTGNYAAFVSENGGIFKLDGNEDFISTSTLYTPQQVNTFSVGIWFKTTDSRGRKLIGFESNQTASSSSYDRQLYIGNDGKLYFGVYDQNAQTTPTDQRYKTIASNEIVNDDHWYYAVGTYSAGGLMKLYLDGIKIKELAASTAAQFSGYWKIGGFNLSGWPNGTNGYLQGSIGPTQVYNRALTDLEIFTNYNAEKANFKASASPSISISGATASSLNVSVNENLDLGTTTAKIVVQRSTSQNGPWTTVSSTKTFTDSNLSASTTFYYRTKVTQSNKKNSDWSLVVSSTTQSSAVVTGDIPALSYSNLTGTSRQINILANPGNGLAVTNYQLQGSTDGVNWTDLPVMGRQSELPDFNTKTPTKIVSKTGPWNNTTTFATMQAAVNTAVPGDIIAVAPGTYTEGFTIKTSGTADKRIYIQALDPNNPPLIDGENVRPSNVPTVQTFIKISASYVTVDSINMTNSNRTFLCAGPSDNNGYFLQSYEYNTFYSNIEILRCKMTNSFQGAVILINIRDSLFGGNELRRCQTSLLAEIATLGNPITYGTCINVMGERISVIENIMGQNYGEPLHLGQHSKWVLGDISNLFDPTVGYYVNPVSVKAVNCVVRGNEVFDATHACIYINSADNCLVENNLFYNSEDTEYWYWNLVEGTVIRKTPAIPGYCIDIGCEGALNRGTSASDKDKVIAARNITIRNNVLFNGQSEFVFTGWPKNTHNNIKIQNNTVFRGKKLPTQFELSSLRNVQQTFPPDRITFENNLIFDPRHDQISTQVVDGIRANTWYATTNSTYRNNLFSYIPPTTMNGPNNISKYDVGINNTNYSVPANPYPNKPTFDLTAFKLLPNSIAVNNGYDNGITTDFFGLPRASSKDIGAVAYRLANNLTFRHKISGASSIRYRARYTKDDGRIGDWSEVLTVPTI